MLSPLQTSNTIWITGGSSGIGKAAAVAMARQATQIVGPMNSA
jgi:NAD(P)-dependent dehydrogenase (short-subunit alcohol dehydrogenase family)